MMMEFRPEWATGSFSHKRKIATPIKVKKSHKDKLSRPFHIKCAQANLYYFIDSYYSLIIYRYACAYFNKFSILTVSVYLECKFQFLTHMHMFVSNSALGKPSWNPPRALYIKEVAYTSL